MSASPHTVLTMTDVSTDLSAAHSPLLDLIVVDCPDAEQLGRFYSQVLGWDLEDGSNRDWATLVPPGGGISPGHPEGHATLAFQRIDDWVAPTWPGGTHPQQFHLDFSVGDIDAAEPRILELGAIRAEQQPSTDGNFRVFLDPAGHPFCLIR